MWTLCGIALHIWTSPKYMHQIMAWNLIVHFSASIMGLLYFYILENSHNYNLIYGTYNPLQQYWDNIPLVYDTWDMFNEYPFCACVWVLGIIVTWSALPRADQNMLFKKHLFPCQRWGMTKMGSTIGCFYVTTMDCVNLLLKITQESEIWVVNLLSQF